MAYLQSQTVADSLKRHAVKRVNLANTETNSVVVNAAALTFAMWTCPTDSSANNFIVGEQVTSASNGTAFVQSVVNATAISLFTVSGTFANNDTITGAQSGRVRTQDGTLTAATHRVGVAHLIYNVTGGANSAIELVWEGTGGSANNRVLAVLSGEGTWHLSETGGRIPNNANSATGNILINTLGWGEGCSYTLIMECSKEQGYGTANTDGQGAIRG